MGNTVGPGETDARGIRQRTALRALGTLYVICGALELLGVGSTFRNESMATVATLLGGGVYLVINGLELRALKASARNFAALPPAIALLRFPVGTAIGAGLLYLLFCKRSRDVFSEARQTSAAACADQDTNYFVRHWRGQLPLATSYWINGALIGRAVAGAVVGAAGATTSGPSDDLQSSIRYALAACVLSFLTFGWSSVGIWRSALRHVDRGGQRAWARLAQCSVVVGVLALLLPVLQARTRARVSETIHLAFGRDPFGRPTIDLSPDQRTLVLDGALGLGSSEAFRQMLSASRGVQTIQLNSNGGRVVEALGIAQQIRGRGLDTYVEKACTSACTLIFLAGRDRGATPNAKIGFHKASFAEQEEVADGDSNRMMAAYREAGVSGSFLAHVDGTSSKSMWYPTRAELLENHIVTRTSLGGETVSRLGGTRSRDELRAQLEKTDYWADVGARFPGAQERILDATWSAVLRGATNAQTRSIARKSISDLIGPALESAPDALLTQFVSLMLAELSAALTVSPQACVELGAGTLDVAVTLPAPLLEQDSAWTRALLRSAPEPPLTPIELHAAKRASQLFFETLSTRERQALSTDEGQNQEPRARCESLLSLYSRLAALPAREQQLVLRQLFRTKPAQAGAPPPNANRIKHQAGASARPSRLGG